MADDIAIRVHDIKKDFYLPHHKSNSIKQSIVQAFKKKDKDIDTFHALRGISFDIKKGEFFGILGRNGSGKSTLLKIISEIYQPTSGSVSHKGTLVSFIELGVGFKEELSGRENVYLNGALLGFSKKEIDKRYDDIVKFAELEEFMEQKIKNYSSGMKVRLAFAVAIQANSDVLVLDEVLAVGDASFQKKCYEYFKSLKESKDKTIVFVTHGMGAVREYCDRAILIENGKIIHSGDAELVADEYTKLFNKDQQAQGNENSERWGTGEITFADTNITVQEDKITVALNLKNNSTRDISGVDIGIDFYDKDKKVVIGGTQYIRKYTKGLSIKSSENKHVKFTFKNNFGGRSYWVNVNIKTDNGSNVCDFWKEALYFTNSFEEERFFPILLDSKVETE